MCPPLPRPDEVELSEVEPGDELCVFRITRSDDPESEEFADSFRSRAELGLPPRPGTPEETHPMIHEGISVYDTQEAAVATALRVRAVGRDIGGFVAEMHVNHEAGIRFLRWGARGHLTLWGDSLMLRLTVVDTIPIA